MKLLTFGINGEDHLGALTEEGIVDLTASDPGNKDFASMQSLIQGGEQALQKAQAAVNGAADLLKTGDVVWRAPLPVPAQVRDCLSFEGHLKNSFASAVKIAAMGADNPVDEEIQLRLTGRYEIPEVWYKQPIYYKGNRFAVAASGEDVHWPAYSNIMDFELEMACIIGVGGKDIARGDADDHIFGYTIYNDFSARDTQMLEAPGMLGPAKSKDFDNSIILGPVIVTKDELADPYNLFMRARINGESWCDSSSSAMHWKFPDLIAHISQSETLYPGEVIGSGTVDMGCGLEHMRFLADGDVVELEIEGIGIIQNRVIGHNA